MRVFADGRLALEASRSIREGDHWLVAGIDVDNGAASMVTANRVERQQGACLSPTPTGTTSCSANSTCAANEFCDTGTGQCAVGCRTNASCSANQTCNANHDCVAIAGTGAANDPCSATPDCRLGLTCNFLLGTCTEPCTSDAGCDACTSASGLPCTCIEFIPGTGFCFAIGG